MKRHGIALWVTLVVCCGVRAEVYKFQVDQPGVRNLGVWRLTHDPTVRDSGNYHNVQCWSHNGRYTCYTHWVGTRGPGGKASPPSWRKSAT